ncbi:hypothetical protein ABD91_00650 [Lysinibacillus sphaericus]|uniref:excalibur calcium-binding domain-containing protein n=1 Tax=Lysinibacillus sphaericus TaxID=1421 RepID=UPI0018CF2678|nr:excalibur calcium-binding domain-containing protein [Lysinibacillus sphaericus]MBG9689436.1 hypothetical protein [Lysinibacillus sphaericus]
MHSKFWTIFFLIIFFPLGLFLMWRHGHFTKQVRVFITLFFLILMLLSSCFGGLNSVKEEELLKKEQLLNEKESRLIELESDLKEREKELKQKAKECEKAIKEQKKLEQQKLEEREKERKKQEEIKQQEEAAQQTTPTTAPQPSLNFRNCTEAKAAGYSNIRRGEAGYSSKLDRDGDGLACDK